MAHCVSLQGYDCLIVYHCRVLIGLLYIIAGFIDLHPDDQLILLKTAFIDIWTVLNASRLSQVQDSVTLSDGIQIPICEVTTVYSVSDTTVYL